jgi:predicted amidophosphoribosyltransferase
VDDVVTTGSTMREAAITLMHSGVQVVAGVAVAGTQFG